MSERPFEISELVVGLVIGLLIGISFAIGFNLKDHPGPGVLLDRWSQNTVRIDEKDRVLRYFDHRSTGYTAHMKTVDDEVVSYSFNKRVKDCD